MSARSRRSGMRETPWKSSHEEPQLRRTMRSRLWAHPAGFVALFVAIQTNVASGVFLQRRSHHDSHRSALVQEVNGTDANARERVVALGQQFEALLSVNFGESLHSVLGRAKDRFRKRVAKNNSSWSFSGKEDASSVTYLQAFVAMGGIADVEAGSDAAKDMVRYFSSELLQLQEEIDAEHLLCDAQQRDLAYRSVEIRRAAESISQRMMTMEVKMADSTGTMLPSQQEVSDLQERLRARHKSCADRRAALTAEEAAALKEPGTAKDLQKRAASVCKDGAAASAFLLEICKDSPETPSWDKPESPPPPGVSANTSQDVKPPSGQPTVCALKSRPTCQALMDAMADMQRTAQQRVIEATGNLAAHDEMCNEDIENLNAQLEQKVVHISSTQENLLAAGGERNEKHFELQGMEKELQSLLQRGKEQQAACADSFTRLEGEICDLLETRQQLYWKFVNDDSASILRDCEVGDWTVGPCSKACTEEQGLPGVRLMMRPVIFQPGKDRIEEELGSSCPATEQTAKCAEAACPQDCKMAGWSGWAACSRPCGGGEQLRTRSVAQTSRNGGKPCAVAVEARSCNIQACANDCSLGDWGIWGICSRRCKFTQASPPGHQTRSRRVVEKAKTGGSCPSDEDPLRLQARECNTELCPEDSFQLNCTGNQDIVMILDGSGSSLPAKLSRPVESHFKEQTAFATNLIQHSHLAGEAKGNRRAGLRYGLIAVGGNQGHMTPRVLSLLTGDREKLQKELQSAELPQGETHTGEALIAALKVLRVSGGDVLFGLEDKADDDLTDDADDAPTTVPEREEVVVFVTDGVSRQPEMTAKIAKRMRNEGVRIMVVLVQNEGSAAAKSAGRAYCAAASAPCADNVLRVQKWEDLNDHLSRFLAAICPVQ
eukprot:TRINITY_DN102123_c0_g1_i1.p1 TRINITY_DN102123_c0_g1~~TRINITY_DN102123_c0_g1_i1.p1  ORF type:complete len:889 (+),score=217.71 TRINITY_DN102123_c0_g1_i1:80-2746(+)